MKSQRIKWGKINLVTYGCEFMTEETKTELKKAIDLLVYYRYIGEVKKADYINRRIREKMNYIEG